MEALIPITMFLSIAAVMILRPVTKRLGMLLETMAKDREQSRQTGVADARIISLLEQMNRRVEMMEERLDFTERLVSNTGRATPPGNLRSRHTDGENAFLVR